MAQGEPRKTPGCRRFCPAPGQRSDACRHADVIFTSNLGIYRLTPEGDRAPNVSPDDLFETVRAKVWTEIERHFKLELGRPEILNRIGENIVVFDFIRGEVAREIFDAIS